MALEKELATYRRQLPHLLASEGKYSLICGDEVAGVWDTYEDALRAGYERFGLEPFMVKQILATERVLFVTREITPSCPS